MNTSEVEETLTSELMTVFKGEVLRQLCNETIFV